MDIIQDACICCTEYRAAIRAEPCGHWISCGPCFVNIFEVLVFLSLKPQNPPFRTRWKTRTRFPHAYFVGHLWRVSRTDGSGCVGSRGSTINSMKCTDYPMEVGGFILSRKIKNLQITSSGNVSMNVLWQYEQRILWLRKTGFEWEDHMSTKKSSPEIHAVLLNLQNHIW